MFRKFVLLMFLFTFVATAAFAEDLNPPSWAGAEDSWYGSWQFYPDDVIWEADYGDYFEMWLDWTDALDLPPLEDEDPYWEIILGSPYGFPEVLEDGGVWWGDGYSEAWFWSEEIWGLDYGSKIIRAQFTVWVEDLANEINPWLGVWADDGYCMWEHTGADAEEWIPFEDILADDVDMVSGIIVDAVDLGGGMIYFCLETEIWAVDAGQPYFGYVYFESESIFLEELVIDFISYDGDEPPVGPSREGGGPPVPQVSYEDPSGTIETLEDVNLTFYAPDNAYGMQDVNTKAYLDTWSCSGGGDPNVDPNNFLQGPFEYSVYWGGTDPCSDDMVLIDPPGAWFPSPADDGGDQQ
ncbi:MAG: hypothetical protein ACYSUK_08415, partial [Planctomycetota bacterium]